MLPPEWCTSSFVFLTQKDESQQPRIDSQKDVDSVETPVCSTVMRACIIRTRHDSFSCFSKFKHEIFTQGGALSLLFKSTELGCWCLLIMEGFYCLCFCDKIWFMAAQQMLFLATGGISDLHFSTGSSLSWEREELRARLQAIKEKSSKRVDKLCHLKWITINV